MFLLLFFFFAREAMSEAAYKFPTLKPASGAMLGWTKIFAGLARAFDGKEVFKIKAVGNLPLPEIIEKTVQNSFHEPINTTNITLSFLEPYITNLNLSDFGAINSSLNIPAFDLSAGLSAALKETVGTESVSDLIFGLVVAAGCSGIMIIVFFAISFVYSFVHIFGCCCCCKAVNKEKPACCTQACYYLGFIFVLLAAIFLFVSLSPFSDLATNCLNAKNAYASVAQNLYKNLDATFKAASKVMVDIPTIANEIGPNLDKAFSALATSLQNDVGELSNALINGTDETKSPFALFEPTGKIGIEIKIMNEKLNAGHVGTVNIDISDSKKEAENSFSQVNSLTDSLQNQILNFSDSLSQQLELISNFSDLNKYFKPMLDNLFNQTDIDLLPQSAPSADELLTTIVDYTNKFHRLGQAALIVFPIILLILLTATTLVFNSKGCCARCCAASSWLYTLLGGIILLVLGLVGSVLGFVVVVLDDNIVPSIDSLTNSFTSMFVDREIEIPDFNISVILEESLLFLNFYGLSFTFGESFKPFSAVIEALPKKGFGDILNINTFLRLTTLLPYLSRFSGESNNQLTKQMAVVMNDKINSSIHKYLPESFKNIPGVPDFDDELSKAEDKAEKIEDGNIKNDAIEKIKNIKSLIDTELPKTFTNFKSEIDTELVQKYTKNFGVVYNASVLPSLNKSFSAISQVLSQLASNLSTILNNMEASTVSGPYAYIYNSIIYDLGKIGNILSISSFFCYIGFFIFALILWIRRKGMLNNDEYREFKKKNRDGGKSSGSAGKKKSRREGSDESGQSDFSDSGTFYLGSRLSNIGMTGSTFHSSKNVVADPTPQTTVSSFWLN